MSLIRWSPFDELDRLRREFDRSLSSLFGEVAGRPPMPRGSAGWWPAVDLVETDGEMILTVDLPGIDPKAIKVEVRKDTVLLEGRVEESREEEADRYWIQERKMQSFQRTIPLPAETDPDRAKATFRDGTLRVEMPKLEPSPRGRILSIED